MSITVLAALASITLAQAPCGAAAPQEKPSPKVYEGAELAPGLESLTAQMEQMKAAVAKVNDYTCRFYRREWKGGERLSLNLTQLKVRVKPKAVYMRWLAGAAKGQEVIWREDWNDAEIRAHQGSFPDVTVNLKVDSWLATRKSRNPISYTGFERLVGLLNRDFERARTEPACFVKLTDEGIQASYGAQARCIDVVTDKVKCPDLYARRAHFCVHQTLGVPNQVSVWDEEDGALRLLGEYAWEDIKVNVGLTPEDFDPANKAYGF